MRPVPHVEKRTGSIARDHQKVAHGWPKARVSSEKSRAPAFSLPLGACASVHGNPAVAEAGPFCDVARTRARFVTSANVGDCRLLTAAPWPKQRDGSWEA